MESELDIIDEVLPLLDIITILIIEADPIIGIVLVALLKLVTEDRIAKISLILLVIVLGTINVE
ncbi:hypothetical protein CR203_03375 [Salipaludibacillus neizhouensis]|uniref:Uncharacterized protein n=1 Tax=Salipaludibacillus neizhouensis TaxID=885475 RepID=A0A3A9KEU5_9BACI|nr:hypothetical protein [Salipaludibacillus neizhouensis]RKL69092.1 hypothetical protein CR203_03375 [Salipaludibacillus neizhouensis]